MMRALLQRHPGFVGANPSAKLRGGHEPSARNRHGTGLLQPRLTQTDFVWVYWVSASKHLSRPFPVCL